MSDEERPDDARRRFAREIDEINRRAQREGRGLEAAIELAEILAEHERECAALKLDLGARNRSSAAG